MTPTEAVQRLEEIERERLVLQKSDRSWWSLERWAEHREKLVQLHELEHECRYCLDRGHPMHLDRPARTGD
jgi:hypothetical protein